eukprot:2685021-Amphidinium_carterae.1
MGSSGDERDGRLLQVLPECVCGSCKRSALYAAYHAACQAVVSVGQGFIKSPRVEAIHSKCCSDRHHGLGSFLYSCSLAWPLLSPHLSTLAICSHEQISVDRVSSAELSPLLSKDSFSMKNRLSWIIQSASVCLAECMCTTVKRLPNMSQPWR